MLLYDTMPLRDYIINDVKPLNVNDYIKDAQLLFNQLTYSHIPLKKDEIYMGCISETDAHCFESDKLISEYLYTIEGFYARNNSPWLDVLESFAQNDTNIMPVLDEKNNYLGYYELNDIISLFNKTPFFSEPGGILIVEKGYNDYSLIDYDQVKPERKDYKAFEDYWNALVNYLVEKYRYTYGSKAKKK